MTFTKKDAILAIIIGLLMPLLTFIIMKNLAFVLPFNKLWLLVVTPPLAVLGLYCAFRIALIWRPFVFQFGKFFLVGSLNSFLDIGMLNLFIMLTGITHGVWFPVFKGSSFVFAVVNSYFWNKLWTFQARQGSFIIFFLVNAGSFLINVGVASFLVNVVGAPDGIGLKQWGNLAALSSVVFVLIWNFLGMKYFVFKKRAV